MDNNMLHPTTSHSSRASIRRISSQNANRADLFSGPAIVGPPDRLDSQSGASEIAQALELARAKMAQSSPTSTPPISEPATPNGTSLATTDKYAFAFDIDGVLIKGGEVIPEAIEAMKVLNGENEYSMKV